MEKVEFEREPFESLEIKPKLLNEVPQTQPPGEYRYKCGGTLCTHFDEYLDSFKQVPK